MPFEINTYKLEWRELAFTLMVICILTISHFSLQKEYAAKPEAQKGPAPGLAYFHIPLPEFASFDSSNFTGVRQ